MAIQITEVLPESNVANIHRFKKKKIERLKIQ